MCAESVSDQSKPLHILHIEDAPNDAELVQGMLEEDDLNCEIVLIDSAEKLRQAIKEPQKYGAPHWDLVLADYSLPSFDGFTALGLHKDYQPDVPFIFFSGTMGEEFAIECLRNGATDYVLKERPGRLTASVRRALREADERNRLKQAEQELRASEERFRLLYDNTPSMFFTVAADGRILSVNEFAATQLGFSKEELKQYSANMLQHPDDRELAANMNAELLKTPGQIQRYEIRLLRKDGSYLWVRKSVRAFENPPGDYRFLVVCEDITEARQLSEELNYQASHDMLTGLVNRREFEKRLGVLLESTRSGEREHILMYMDLDQFKVVNDTCGHVAGDELLRQLGDLLKTQIRRGDTVARLGGDEFGLLFEHCSRDKGIKIADNVLHEIQAFRFVWGDKSFSMGASIGLVCINSTSTTTPEIMSAADTACYAAKDAGRNRVQMYYDSDTELSRRRGEMRWVSRINEALNEDRFYLVAQEIIPVAAESNDVHLELLLRMRDETGQMVPPDAFLPAAERYNLSASIDRWVIKTALEWLQATPEIAGRLSFCSINISGLSLGNEDFLDYVDTALKSSHIAGDNLCFEITETAAIVNLANARRFIQTLSACGCKFALDDFGTGLSSFAYLKNLPVDYLKIDGGFVRDMVTDKIDRAMVRSINEIGHVMGKKTIAEFVENDEILAILRQLGVDYAQGYGIGRPLPLAEFRPHAARK